MSKNIKEAVLQGISKSAWLVVFGVSFHFSFILTLFSCASTTNDSPSIYGRSCDTSNWAYIINHVPLTTTLKSSKHEH